MDGLYCHKVSPMLPRFESSELSAANALAMAEMMGNGDPHSPVKTDRKAQNYRWGIPTLGRQSKVKPLFRYLIRTCNILGMCGLRMPRDVFKMSEGVARKLFATIRYRFSHLDNGLIWKTSYDKVLRRTATGKSLTICELISEQEPLRAHRVPVVVAD